MNKTDEHMMLISELVEVASKLPKVEQEHLLWVSQGILFATQKADENK